MKNKINRGINYIVVLLLMMFSITIKANAAGTATVGFSGNSSTPLNSNITLKLTVSNISGTNGGVVSMGGNLNFDSNYLQYVSGTGITTPYTFQINTAASYKIAGLDTTLSNGITSTSPVFTVVFKPLKTGSTTVSFTNGKLTDTKGTVTTTYQSKTITIGGLQNTDATLKSLDVTGYSIVPKFDSSVNSYTLSVPENVEKINVTATPTVDSSFVTGIGTKNLIMGKNNIEVKVTSENGTVNTYTISVTRGESSGDGDATLKELSVTGYTLSPAFDKNITKYSMSVNNNITSLSVEAIPTLDTSKVTVTGNTSLSVGSNTITAKVTAEDGTVNSYIVTVTRKEATSTATKVKESNNMLKTLTISNGELKPSFDEKINSYSVTIPYEATALDIIYETKSNKAKVVIKDNKDLKIGAINIVTIEVTAEDGSVREYTINVTRSSITSNNKLESLTVKNGLLEPGFKDDVYEYDINVASNVDKLDISAIAKNKEATVEITGNNELKPGNNVILVRVTDENNLVQYYLINVKKAAENGFTLFGLSTTSTIYALIGLALLGFLIFLFGLLSSRRKSSYVPPVIEIKPEFNFYSKNMKDSRMIGTDSKTAELPNEPNNFIEANYEEKEIPYDPYDDIVTKDEVIDAIQEKDARKLKMLYRQEMLNREKEELKQKDIEKAKNDKNEEDGDSFDN